MCRTPKLREHGNLYAEKTDAQMDMLKGASASLLPEGKSSSAHLREGRTPGSQLQDLAA